MANASNTSSAHAHFIAPSNQPPDIAIISTDGIVYKLHKDPLSFQSELFADLFASSTAPEQDQHDNLPVIRLKRIEGAEDFERSAVLDIVLAFFYNVPDPDLISIIIKEYATALHLFAFARKYGMLKSTERLVEVLKTSVHLSSNDEPVKLLGSAVRHGHQILAATAKPHALKRLVLFPEEARLLPAETAISLLIAACNSRPLPIKTNLEPLFRPFKFDANCYPTQPGAFSFAPSTSAAGL